MINTTRVWLRLSMIVFLLVSAEAIGHGAVPVVPTSAPNGARAVTSTSMPATRPSLKLAVTPEGEIRLSTGEKLIASGHWTFYHAFRDFYGNQTWTGDLTSSTAVQDAPDHALVSDIYSNAKITTDIKLEGEDLSLRMHVQNLETARSLSNLTMHGLTYHFARNANGTIPSWHVSYMATVGPKLFHPSLAQPIGVVYARDDQFAFSTFSSSEFDQQSLFSAEWVKDGIIPAECNVTFSAMRDVAPGQSVDMDVNFRISSDFSMQHLLEPYKKLYTKHFPKLLYKADSRPVGEFAQVADTLITPSNPLGFGGAFRRLDSAAGTAAYIRMFAPPLQNGGAVGMIFWSPGGFIAPMYPPDFDVFPKVVQDNIPALVAGFKKHGLRVGLCARCGDGITRDPGKDAVLYRLNADDPEQMKTLMDRFDHAMSMGFDMFYLDSFGIDNPNDQKILEKVRARVGKDVLLYTEYCTDMSLPYSGHYCEWHENAITWTSDEQYATLRYLCPDSTWIAMSRTRQPIPPAYAKLGLTPLVEDGNCRWLPTSRPSK